MKVRPYVTFEAYHWAGTEESSRLLPRLTGVTLKEHVRQEHRCADCREKRAHFQVVLPTKARAGILRPGWWLVYDPVGQAAWVCPPDVFNELYEVL